MFSQEQNPLRVRIDRDLWKYIKQKARSWKAEVNELADEFYGLVGPSDPKMFEDPKATVWQDPLRPFIMDENGEIIDIQTSTNNVIQNAVTTTTKTSVISGENVVSSTNHNCQTNTTRQDVKVTTETPVTSTSSVGENFQTNTTAIFESTSTLKSVVSRTTDGAKHSTTKP